MLAKAAAWYQTASEAAMREATNTVEQDDADGIDDSNGAPLGSSFPWVVADLLCDVARHVSAPSAAPNAEQQLCLDVGRSALLAFTDALPALTEASGRADSIALLVANALNNNDGSGRWTVAVYGSASVFLCDAVSSDVDLCIAPPLPTGAGLPAELVGLNEAQVQRHWLSCRVWPALDEVASEKVGTARLSHLFTWFCTVSFSILKRTSVV